MVDCGHMTKCCTCDENFGYCLVKCACGCCCAKPNPNGYSTCQKITPALFYLVFGLASVACGLTAYTQTGTFNTGLQDLSCGLDGLAVETIAFVDEMEVATRRVYTDGAYLFDNVRKQIDTTSVLTNDLDEFSAAVDAAASMIKTLPEGTRKAAPLTDAYLTAQVTAIKAEFEGEPRTIAVALTDLRAKYQEKVVDQKTEMVTTTKMFSLAESLVKYFLDAKVKDNTKLLKKSMAPIEDNQPIAGLAALLLIILPFAMTVIGIFLVFCGKLTTCSHSALDNVDDICGKYIWGCSTCVAFLGLIICFIAGAVMLPSSILVSDVCVVMEGIAPNMDSYIPPPIKAMTGAAKIGLELTGSVDSVIAETAKKMEGGQTAKMGGRQLASDWRGDVVVCPTDKASLTPFMTSSTVVTCLGTQMMKIKLGALKLKPCEELQAYLNCVSDCCTPTTLGLAKDYIATSSSSIFTAELKSAASTCNVRRVSRREEKRGCAVCDGVVRGGAILVRGGLICLASTNWNRK